MALIQTLYLNRIAIRAGKKKRLCSAEVETQAPCSKNQLHRWNPKYNYLNSKALLT